MRLATNCAATFDRLRPSSVSVRSIADVSVYDNVPQPLVCIVGLVEATL